MTDAASAPPRSRPDTEWSIAVREAGASADRWVLHGREERWAEDFLAVRGRDPSWVGWLRERHGPPDTLSVGAAEGAPKLYWLWERGRGVGLELPAGGAPGVKHYRRVPLDHVARELGRLPEALAAQARWVLAAAGAGAFDHAVLVRRDTGPAATGIHLGFVPDWEGMLSRSEAPLRADLAGRLLARLGLAEHEARVRAFLAPPLAWMNYLSLHRGPGAAVGVTFYARPSLVVPRRGRLAAGDTGRSGFRAWPLRVAFRLAAAPEVELRLGDPAAGPGFAEAGAWALRHGRAEGPVAPALGAAREVAAACVGPRDAQEPHRLAARLRAHPAVAWAAVEPDLGT